MAYLQNMRLINQYPVRHGCYHGTLERSMWGPKTGTWKNQFLGAIDPKAAFPNGYEHPFCWFQSRSPGNLSAYKTIEGGGNVSAYLLMGINLLAPSPQITGSGEVSISSSLSLVVQAAATLLGSGTISPTSSLAAILKMTADLAGAGEISISTALGVIAWCISEIMASGTLDGSNLKGKASMSADITSAGDLVTAQSCAIAVWNSLAASFNDPGTMGEKLNDAGSAANPWTENLPGSYIPGQAGYIVGTNLDAAVSGVADDVWNHVDAQLLLELVTLQEAYVNNKKGLVKVGSTWHFRIYDAAGTGIIKDKELKDKDGNDITDIAAGALALELMSSV